MAKKQRSTSRRTSKAKRSTRRQQKQSPSYFWLKLVFTLAFISAVGLFFLDLHIRHQFEGKRWALPAKVYARPLELFAGAPLSLKDFKLELSGLGYQFVSKVTKPGQAAFSETQAVIATRGFLFPDGKEAPEQLRLNFNGDTLTALSNRQGEAVALYRLEPALIGGIYPLNNEDRDLIQLEHTPQALIESLIAIEDRNFYQHHGISLKGIARAMWANIRAGGFVQGGSTLTQQLIKNFYLTSDRSLLRKLLEVPMALLLEAHYSKDEILEAYLNEVYLGQDGARAIHGFGLGAHYFFAQPIEELKLHQLALLAGLVKGPSYYDPRRHPERAKKRRDLVLKVLHEEGKISDRAYQIAQAAPLDVVKQGSLQKGAYPAFLDLVKRLLRQNYHDEDLSSEGLRVFTSLDPISQRKAETALVNSVNKLGRIYGKRAAQLQGSMVVSNPQTGEVLALIGDRNTRYQGFNRALDLMRPVGSLVKPAVYLSALEQGHTLITPIDDAPYTLKLPNGDVWQPQNFEKTSHGMVPLHEALTHSYNIATARLGMEIGLDNILDTLRSLGINRPLKAYPSLVLGAQSLSPLEVATMYQTIAANGFQMPLRAIRSVTDSEGKALSRYPFQLKQTIDARYMHLLQYNLQEVARSGTARSIYQSLPASMNVAGKTGTSNEQRDSWFAGFAANRLAVVWLGRDDNQPLPFTGSGGALRVWRQYMASAPLESFSPAKPNGVEYVWIDPVSGKLSSAGCEGAQQIPFINGTAPTEHAACYTETPTNSEASPVDWLKRWF
jgi:penicillin-binding protein 1B